MAPSGARIFPLSPRHNQLGRPGVRSSLWREVLESCWPLAGDEVANVPIIMRLPRSEWGYRSVFGELPVNDCFPRPAI